MPQSERAFGIMLFFAAALAAAFGVVLQAAFREWAPIAPDFALAALIAVGFFLSFKEFVPLVLMSAWVLNWEPGISAKLLLFMLIPLGAFFLKRLSPWYPWLTNLAAVCLGAALFYFGDRGAIAADLGDFFQILVIDLLFAAVLFEFLKRFGKPVEYENLKNRI